MVLSLIQANTCFIETYNTIELTFKRVFCARIQAFRKSTFQVANFATSDPN